MRRLLLGIAAGSLLAVEIIGAGNAAATRPSACSTAKRTVVALVRRTAPRSVVEAAKSPAYTGGGVTSSYCVDLTADGSADLLVNVGVGGTIGGIAWLVYRGPANRLVHVSDGQPNGGMRRLSARPSDGDVVESEPKYLSADPNCCPTGGMLYRRFHWQNGKHVLVKKWEGTAP
jgi:hypothetical protein